MIVAPEARADLARIIDHLSSVASVATATRWNDRLWSAIKNIASFPGSGAPRPRLGAHVRIKVVAPYIIIYEHDKGAGVAYVLRVVHGHRNITKRLLREPGK